MTRSRQSTAAAASVVRTSGFTTGVIALIVAQIAVAGQQPRNARAVSAEPNFNDVQITVVPVKGNVYLLAGAGGNTTVQIGDDGVLIVDTQFAPMAGKIVAEVRKLTDKPIRYVVNTHAHPDHVGGNEAIAQQGLSLGGANVVGLLGNQAIAGAKIIAHQNVLNRLSAAQGNQPAMPSGAWPTDTYVVPMHDLYFNGETVRLIHVPNAHTDGDSIVYFRGSDVISTGDLFTTVMYPFIDHMSGGNLDGIIAGLNTVLDIAVPAAQQQGGTMIVSGHGRITDEHEVLEYRDMLVIIRDRIKDMTARGMTLDQVKAAKPTLDYDPRFGADSGFWTTAQFIEAVYRDVANNR